jgi:hypothetical protein
VSGVIIRVFVYVKDLVLDFLQAVATALLSTVVRLLIKALSFVPILWVLYKIGQGL